MTVSDKHLEIKKELRLIFKILFLEGRVSKNTFDEVNSRIAQITDSPFELFSDLVGSGFVECQVGDKKFKYEVKQVEI